MHFPNMLAKLNTQIWGDILASSYIKLEVGALVFSVSVGYFD